MKVTREKHLDHMVKVVPLIVMGYALQCYIISGMNTSIGSTSILVLGGLLGAMIAGFITYDVKHQVTLSEDHLEISFLAYYVKIPYSEIQEIKKPGNEQNFGTLIFHCEGSKHRLYFIDDADKVKAFIDEKKTKTTELKAA